MAWGQLKGKKDENHPEASNHSKWKQTAPENLKPLTEIFMLFTIAIILFVAWLLGLVSSYTLGGFLHILLVLAIIMLLVGVIQGRRGV